MTDAVRHLDSRFRGKDRKEKVDFESTLQNPSATSRGSFNSDDV